MHGLGDAEFDCSTGCSCLLRGCKRLFELTQDLVLADYQGVDTGGQFQEVAGHGLALDERKPVPPHLVQELLKATSIPLHQHLNAVAGLEQEHAAEPFPRFAEKSRLVREPERLKRGDVGGVVADARDREGDHEWFRHGGTS